MILPVWRWEKCGVDRGVFSVAVGVLLMMITRNVSMIKTSLFWLDDEEMDIDLSVFFFVFSVSVSVSLFLASFQSSNSVLCPRWPVLCLERELFCMRIDDSHSPSLSFSSALHLRFLYIQVSPSLFAYPTLPPPAASSFSSLTLTHRRTWFQSRRLFFVWFFLFCYWISDALYKGEWLCANGGRRRERVSSYYDKI